MHVNMNHCYNSLLDLHQEPINVPLYTNFVFVKITEHAFAMEIVLALSCCRHIVFGQCSVPGLKL